MNVKRLIRREILHRKLNFALGSLAITAAVALFVAFFSAGQASKLETIRLMRDIGFNLRVIPAGTDMDRFWISGFSEQIMPERYVQDLAAFPGISYNHLTATLQRKILWRDHEAILTGMGPEIIPPGKASSLMTFSIQPGTAYIGFELAENLHLTAGDTIKVDGHEFRIDRCLSETGSQDDIRIFTHLRDAQAILHLEDQINEIKALQCLCNGEYDLEDSLDLLRVQLKTVLPDAKVILMQSIAKARLDQRLMAERYFSFVFPLIVLVAMAWIGILAFLNVRERRQEIGILRALGYGSSKIALLFLGKAVIMGLMGAALGFVVGTVLATQFGPQIFKVTAQSIRPSLALLGWSMLISPLIAAAAVFLPSLMAVYQDPAQTLRAD
jgi:ABC-type lipoprotein release transport system permease subunit